MVDDLDNPADFAGDVKTTVQTSKFGSQVLERLIDSRYFPDNQTGLRFAIAIAVSKGIILPRDTKFLTKMVFLGNDRCRSTRSTKNFHRRNLS